MTITSGIPSESACVACKAPCPLSRFRARLDGAPRKAAKLVENVLSRSGFEVAHRLSLSRLVEERLGMRTRATEVLFLKHPLLLLQYFFTGGEPALLFPFVVILQGHGHSTLLCLCSPWPSRSFRSNSLASRLAKLAEEKIVRAALDLEGVKGGLARDASRSGNDLALPSESLTSQSEARRR